MRSEPHPLRRTPPRWERHFAEWWGPRPRGVPTAVFVVVWAAVLTGFGAALREAILALERHIGLRGLDVGAERWLAAHRTPLVNTMTHVASSLANTTEAVVVALLLAVLAGIAWRRWAEPAMLVIAMLGQLVVHVCVTAIVERPRAAHALALVVAVAIPATVAFARMYRGMHYPTDVVGATLLSALWLVVSVHAVGIGAHHHVASRTPPRVPTGASA